MVPSADENGKSRSRSPENGQKRTVSIGKLMTDPEFWSKMAVQALHRSPEFAFLKKWGCPIQELVFEPRAAEVLSQMYKLWPRLTPNERRLYLETAESIAEAEKAKSIWNPKTTRERHIRVAKTAIAAAKLVREISSIFPPPWLGDEAEIGELVFELTSFISGTMDATFPWTRGAAIRTASGLLRTTKTRISRKTGGMKWELLRDLVWLASGKKLDLDERAVRRYLGKQPSQKDLAAAYWRPNWPIVRHAFVLARECRTQPQELDKVESSRWAVPLTAERRLDTELFERAVHLFLISPCVSITSG
jgi:hypothetical protein